MFQRSLGRWNHRKLFSVRRPGHSKLFRWFKERRYLTVNWKDTIFTRDSFRNWKTACDTSKRFAKHSRSKAHVLSMTMWDEKLKYLADGSALEKMCGEQLNATSIILADCSSWSSFWPRMNWRFEVRKKMLMDSILACFWRWLSTLKPLTGNLPRSAKLLPRMQNTLSPQFQNELISILAELVKRKVIKKLKERDFGLFAIKCDEARDNSGVELLTIVSRFVSKDGLPCEKCLDFTT